MKIQIIRYANGNMADVLRITSEGWRKYANRHGYHYHEHCYESPRPHLEKLRLLTFHTEANWNVWIDADCAVTNDIITLESYCMGLAETILFGSDSNGLCAGQIFVRKSQTAHNIINAVRAVGSVDADTDKQFGGITGHEQNAFKLLIKHFPDVAAQCRTLGMIQSYPSQWKPGDFIFHAAQRTNEERLALLRSKCVG